LVTTVGVLKALKEGFWGLSDDNVLLIRVVVDDAVAENPNMLLRDIAHDMIGKVYVRPVGDKNQASTLRCVAPITDLGAYRKQLLHTNARTGTLASSMRAAGVPHIETQYVANKVSAMVVSRIGESILAKIRNGFA